MARLGVAFSGGLTPPEIVECVKLAEDLGYDSAWVTEGHGGDQFAVLAACAVQTSRIRLGTSISSIFVRSAPTIAMAAATVDHLSGGRFILGLGSSHRVQVVGEHGLPYSRPIERLREAVDVVRTLLRDGVVSHRGELLQIERFDLWFRPLRPVVPVYLSGVFRPMLEVCGEIADGAILTSSTLDWARSAAAHVAAGARRAGRDPAERSRWRRSLDARWARPPRRASGSSRAWPCTPDPFRGTTGSSRRAASPRPPRPSARPGSAATATARWPWCPTLWWTRSHWPARPPSAGSASPSTAKRASRCPSSPRASSPAAAAAVQEAIRACAPAS